MCDIPNKKGGMRYADDLLLQIRMLAKVMTSLAVGSDAWRRARDSLVSMMDHFMHVCPLARQRMGTDPTSVICVMSDSAC